MNPMTLTPEQKKWVEAGWVLEKIREDGSIIVSDPDVGWLDLLVVTPEGATTEDHWVIKEPFKGWTKIHKPQLEPGDPYPV